MWCRRGYIDKTQSDEPSTHNNLLLLRSSLTPPPTAKKKHNIRPSRPVRLPSGAFSAHLVEEGGGGEPEPVARVKAPVGVEEVDLEDAGALLPGLPQVAAGEEAGQLLVVGVVGVGGSGLWWTADGCRPVLCMLATYL